MHYNIDELARAANISPRSIYSYTQRHLIPSAMKDGREFIYTDEHLEALRLVKILLRLGLPLRQVEVLVAGRDRNETRQALAPVFPLAKLLEEAEIRVAELQRKLLEPDIEELDLSNLGLEDPLALRHNLAEAERQQKRLREEFENSGADVLRELVSSTEPHKKPINKSGPVTSTDDLTKIHLQLQALENKISEQLTEMQRTFEQLLNDKEKKAFVTGLVVAQAAGWQPSIMSTPLITLAPEFIEAFHTFVISQQK
jgi:DNA-binding transcriptional MerR regulator